MERWMGLDVGTKTIGVAVTDPLKLTARPLSTLRREDIHKDARQLLVLIGQLGVGKLIVGKPIHMNGTPSATLDAISPLVEYLQALTPIPVVWTDERLSTKEAEELMRSAGLGPAQQRLRRNEFAAAVILRRHLEEPR